jgi:hypothetical protein
MITWLSKVDARPVTHHITVKHHDASASRLRRAWTQLLRPVKHQLGYRVLHDEHSGCASMPRVGATCPVQVAEVFEMVC